jgi:hypothetical protein
MGPIVKTISATTLPLATETVIATLQLVGVRAGQRVLVEAVVPVFGAVSATTCTLRIRRGSLAGAVVQANNPHSVDGAATDRSLSISAAEAAQSDDPTYVLTGTSAGAQQTTDNGHLKGQLVN